MGAPEAGERGGPAESVLCAARREQPVECGADVVELALEPVEPPCLVGTCELALGGQGELDEAFGVAASKLVERAV